MPSGCCSVVATRNALTSRRPGPTADQDAFLSSGFSVETYQRDHQVSRSSMRSTEPLEVMRRLWALPTFDVHSVVGGYVAPGVKTAIAPSAEVKVSC